METIKLGGKPGYELEVNNNSVHIVNKLKRLDKTIPLSQIISVQLKKKGLMGPGYIYFQTVGGLNTKVKNPNEVIADENSWILVSDADYETALKMKKKIEEYNPNDNKASSFSSADEILKYKGLLDVGAITQEEYNEKKKQLLDDKNGSKVVTLIQCPECGREMSSSSNVCPNCGFSLKKNDIFEVRSTVGQNDINSQSNNTARPIKKRKGCLMGCLVAVAIFIGFGAFTIFVASNSDEIWERAIAGEQSSVNTIISAEDYNRITSARLFEKMGQVQEGSPWISKTSKGDFDVTTYEFDNNNIHYEFIVANDVVVRATFYSQQYWTNQGERFKFDSLGDVFPMFGISKGNNLKKVVDNNSTLKYSSVSVQVDEFNVQDINLKDKTFGFVRVTYNSDYFN